MSSNDKAEVIVDHVPLEEVVEGENMDLTMLDSSDHEDSEQGRKVDEAIHQESGSGTDNAKLDDEMEVNVDNPKVGADTVKPEDEMEVAGNINQELSPDSCAANNKKLFSVTLEIKVNFRKNGSETSKNDHEKSSN